MDSYGLPIVGPGVDLTKVGAIHQKRLLAFLNHYVTRTSRFLNKFSNVCEEKLSDISLRIQRLETSMNILEAKLASIPGLENVTVASTGTTNETTSSKPPQQTQQPTTHQPEVSVEENIEPQNPQKATKTVAQDPRYAKYFKMINMGVPLQAIKPRLIADGLNPDLLETPNAPIDDDFQSEENDSDSGSSASSFDD